MSVNVFPAPAAGGGGGGSSLPEGAVEQIIQGKLTATGFDYGETLLAGNYLVNANGNAVNIVLGDAGTTKTISGSGTLTLDSNESNLSMSLAENFGGDPVLISGNLPQPTLQGFTTNWARGVSLAVDPVNGHMAITRAQSSNNTSTAWGIRDESGIVRYRSAVTVDDNRYGGTAIDQNNNYYFAFKSGANYRLMKYSGETGVTSYPYSDSTWFANSQGLSGVAITPDAQTIVITGHNESKAATSVNGGLTWTNVNLPLQPFCDTTFGGQTLKYQNGRFFVSTSANGQFMTSTDGLSWNAYTIPGATTRVTGYAYDGTTFLFATGNVNTIWKTTTLGSYTAVSVAGGFSLGMTHVEYGEEKWMVTSMGSATNGNSFISTNNAVSFFCIDASGDFTYGNQMSMTNLLYQSAATQRGVNVTQLQQKLLYDPLYKSFVSNAWFQSTGTNAEVMDLLNVDHGNYYKWMYNILSGTANVSPNVLDAITWSPYMERYYYNSSAYDDLQIRLSFSYDPVTGNVRTEPFPSLTQSQNQFLTGVGQTAAGNKMVLNGKAWFTYQTGGTNTGVGYTLLASPQQFWGTSSTNYTSSSAFQFNNGTKPFIFPDGSAALLQTSTTSTTCVPTIAMNVSGNVTATWYLPNTTSYQLYSAMTSGNFYLDTVAKTVSVYNNTNVWQDIPYPLPNLTSDNEYRTTFPTSSAFYYRRGDTTIVHNVASDTFSVSTNSGLSFRTVDAPTNVTNIVEKQGVYYIITTFKNASAVASTTDFVNYKLLSITQINEQYPLFEYNDNRPNGTIENPAIMDRFGSVVQLFSDPALQPEANVFVYDMNLQEL